MDAGKKEGRVLFLRLKNIRFISASLIRIPVQVQVIPVITFLNHCFFPD